MGSEIYKWEINFFLLLIYLGGEECLSTPLDLEKICAEVMSAKSPCLVGISDDAGRYNIEQKLVIFFLFLSSFRIIKVKSIWERKKKIVLLSFILIFQVSLWIYLLHVFVYQARHLLFYSCSSRWLSLQLGGIGWNSETCDLSNASTT